MFETERMDPFLINWESLWEPWQPKVVFLQTPDAISDMIQTHPDLPFLMTFSENKHAFDDVPETDSISEHTPCKGVIPQNLLQCMLATPSALVMFMEWKQLPDWLTILCVFFFFCFIVMHCCILCNNTENRNKKQTNKQTKKNRQTPIETAVHSIRNMYPFYNFGVLLCLLIPESTTVSQNESKNMSNVIKKMSREIERVSVCMFPMNNIKDSFENIMKPLLITLCIDNCKHQVVVLKKSREKIRCVFWPCI